MRSIKRLLRAPCAGTMRLADKRIGDRVTVGEVTCYIDETPVLAMIDGMLRGVSQAAAKAGNALADPQAVYVRLADGLHAIGRTDLAARLADGTLAPTTPVVDLALLTLGDLRRGKLERPLAATWIGRKFGIHSAV